MEPLKVTNYLLETHYHLLERMNNVSESDIFHIWKWSDDISDNIPDFNLIEYNSLGPLWLKMLFRLRSCIGSGLLLFHQIDICNQKYFIRIYLQKDNLETFIKWSHIYNCVEFLLWIINHRIIEEFTPMSSFANYSFTNWNNVLSRFFCLSYLIRQNIIDKYTLYTADYNKSIESLNNSNNSDNSNDSD